MNYKSPKLLLQRKQLILDLWMQDQLKGKTTTGQGVKENELENQCEELVDVLLEAISEYNTAEADPSKLDPVNEILTSISISHARQGLAASETALFIFSLKDAIVEVLKEEFKYEPSRLFEEAAWICKILERLSVTSLDSFIRGREEVFQGQPEKISELAAPVLRVWEGIVAMPVTGTLDPAGARSIMENLLQGIADSGSAIAILDISGVPSVDEAVARHLCDTVTATRLMGAECILSGIRPEAARVMVDLGIDLSNFITKATLASALRFAFRMQGTDTNEAGPPPKI